jgi:hypothetical protein
MEVKQGTINIILEIDANLPPGTMTRALVTCTEAKTAALQELIVGSRYSQGLATGSGTDGTIIISNPNSSVKLTDAGKHSKLGELIGVTVKTAVKEALYKETDLSPERQHSFLHRFKRYGLDEESLWRRYLNLFETPSFTKNDFIRYIYLMDKQDKVVVVSSLYIHLMDQFRWGLLNREEVKLEADLLLDNLKEFFKINERQINLNIENENFIKEMVASFEKLIIAIINS